MYIIGEEPFSFGYGGTGKKSSNCKFEDYGEKFSENDIIGCYIVIVFLLFFYITLNSAS